MPEEATPQEEVKKEEVQETSTSEKVENSEETQTQETKPEVQEVSQEEKEEEKETPKEEVSETESKSVLDELLSGAQKKAEPVEEATETKSVADKTGTGDFEKEIARTAFPRMDPNSSEWDPKFEEKVVKEYLYRWALAGGDTSPTLRSVATQISKEEADAITKPVDQKKADAIAQPSTVTGTEAEKTITAEQEKTLLEGAKFGNQKAIVDLLRARREKSE